MVVDLECRVQFQCRVVGWWMAGEWSLHHHNQLLNDEQEVWYPWSENRGEGRVVNEDE